MGQSFNSLRDREPRAGEHAFFGLCDQLERLSSFSYGVFLIKPGGRLKTGGLGLRKSAAVVRVHCHASPSERSRRAARAVAEAVCRLLDEGELLPRSVTVGRCEAMLRARLAERGLTAPDGLSERDDA